MPPVMRRLRPCLIMPVLTVALMFSVHSIERDCVGDAATNMATKAPLNHHGRLSLKAFPSLCPQDLNLGMAVVESEIRRG